MSKRKIQELRDDDAEDQDIELDEEDSYTPNRAAKILFGSDRKMIPVDKSLPKLYIQSIADKLPEPIPNKKAVMFLLVDMDTFEVIENCHAIGTMTAEEWRIDFQNCIADWFYFKKEEVYDTAAMIVSQLDHKPDNDEWGDIIACAYPLYRHLDPRRQKRWIRNTKKAVDDRLHPEKRRARERARRVARAKKIILRRRTSKVARK